MLHPAGAPNREGAFVGAPKVDQAKSERVARMMIAQLIEWARARPDIAEELTDCADEIGWSARLKPVEATPPHQTAKLKHGVKQIVTTLSLWAQVYREHAQVLNSCAAQVEVLEQRRRPRERSARDLVLDALLLGHGTSVQISEFTGLDIRRVQRALVRLERLRLAEDAGCGARTPEDGNRTRLWRLRH